MQRVLFFTLFTCFFTLNAYSLEWSLSISSFDLFEDEAEVEEVDCADCSVKKPISSVKSLKKEFCTRPYKVLCKDIEGIEKEKTKIKRDLKTFAFEYHFNENKEILERHGIYQLDDKTMEKFEEIMSVCSTTEQEKAKICEVKNDLEGVDLDSVYSDTKKTKKEFKDVLEEQLIDVYITKINHQAVEHLPLLNSVYSTSRQLLIDTISDNLKSTSIHSFELTPNKDLINKLTKVINSVRPIFTIDERGMEGLTEDQKNEAATLFMEVCGNEAEHDNAVAYEEGGTKFVLFCPMDYLPMIEGEKNQLTQKLHARLISTIVHEVAHHFLSHDPKVESPIEPQIKQLLNCMANNYMGNEGIHQKPQDYKHEVMADYWANRALGKLFETDQFKQMSFKEKVDILKLYGSSLCNTIDDGTHPSGGFRLDQMLYRTPEIFKAMKCYKEIGVVVTSCELEGPNVLNLGF